MWDSKRQKKNLLSQIVEYSMHCINCAKREIIYLCIFITSQSNLKSCHCGHRKLSTIDRQIPVLDVAETGSILTFTFCFTRICFVRKRWYTHKYEWDYCYLPPVPKQKQYHGKIIIPGPKFNPLKNPCWISKPSKFPESITWHNYNTKNRNISFE